MTSVQEAHLGAQEVHLVAVLLVVVHLEAALLEVVLMILEI